MAQTGRPRSCDCGECKKCAARIRERARWEAKTPDERRAAAARRDHEKVKAADRARSYRDREKRLAYQKQWKAANHEKFLESCRQSHARYPEKAKARRLFTAAVRSGKLIRSSTCEDCGAEAATQGHHEDYTQPLIVVWLCTGCHGARHRKEYAA